MTSCVAKRTRFGNSTVSPGKSYFDVLLPECLTEIFSYLDIRDRGNAAQVCSLWRDVLNQKVLWQGAVAKIHLKKFNPAMFRGLVKRGIKKVQVRKLYFALHFIFYCLVDNIFWPIYRIIRSHPRSSRSSHCSMIAALAIH